MIIAFFRHAAMQADQCPCENIFPVVEPVPGSEVGDCCQCVVQGGSGFGQIELHLRGCQVCICPAVGDGPDPAVGVVLLCDLPAVGPIVRITGIDGFDKPDPSAADHTSQLA